MRRWWRQKVWRWRHRRELRGEVCMCVPGAHPFPDCPCERGRGQLRDLARAEFNDGR